MIENKEFFKMATRIIKAGSRRVADGDCEDLMYLRNLQTEIDRALAVAVAGLRSQGHSWACIASGLGLTRQYCQKQWGKQ